MRTITVFQSADELIKAFPGIPATVTLQFGLPNDPPALVGEGSDSYRCEGFTNAQVILAAATQVGLRVSL